MSLNCLTATSTGKSKTYIESRSMARKASSNPEKRKKKDWKGLILDSWQQNLHSKEIGWQMNITVFIGVKAFLKSRLYLYAIIVSWQITTVTISLMTILQNHENSNTTSRRLWPYCGIYVYVNIEIDWYKVRQIEIKTSLKLRLDVCCLQFMEYWRVSVEK